MAATGLVGGFLGEVFNRDIYKRNQGRFARQVTFFAILVVVLLAGWQLMGQSWIDFVTGAQYFVPFLFVAIFAWLDFRLVNYPQFADFLIAVEAEMYKVSWPSYRELYRSSLVVIFVIFVMAGLLFFFDLIWRALFELLNIVQY